MLKRMTIAIVAVLVSLPALASAKDMTGRLGLGYYHSDAPVGIRYWFSPKAGLDLGVGFENKDLGEESATSFWIEAGLPYVFVSTERANFYLRLGVQYGMLDDRVYGSGQLDDTWSQFLVSVAPGAEVFFGEHFSLSAHHGIAVEILSPPEGDSATSFGTFGEGVSELGFHFYF